MPFMVSLRMGFCRGSSPPHSRRARRSCPRGFSRRRACRLGRLGGELAADTVTDRRIRPRARRVPLHDLKHVPAGVAGDRIAELAHGQAERRAFELGRKLTTLHPAEKTAARCVRGAGERARDGQEVLAGADPVASYLRGCLVGEDELTETDPFDRRRRARGGAPDRRRTLSLGGWCGGGADREQQLANTCACERPARGRRRRATGRPPASPPPPGSARTGHWRGPARPRGGRDPAARRRSREPVDGDGAMPHEGQAIRPPLAGEEQQEHERKQGGAAARGHTGGV